MKEQTDFAKYLAKFLSIHLPHERNFSPNTISSYRDAFVLYLSFMRKEKGKKAENVILADITRDNVLDYLEWLADTQKSSISTRNNRLAAIHAFVSYLQYQCVDRLDQLQGVLAIKSMKKVRPVPVHYTREGMQAILAQPDPGQRDGIRHLAILEVMYDTGCRVQELADLTVGSLRIQAKPFTVKIVGKGRKVRIVPLSDPVVNTLKKYIHVYGIDLANDAKVPLFTNKYHSKLTRAGITYILQKYADMARMNLPGLIPEHISCHQVRHTRAMNLQAEGVSLVWIRDLLGHESVQTTEIYARTASRQRQEAIEKASEMLNPNPAVSEWNHNPDLLSWLKSLGKK